MMETTSKR